MLRLPSFLLSLVAGAALAAPALAQQATDTAAAAPTGEGGVQAIREDMLLGYWSDEGDCSSGMLFRPDKTFHSFRTGDDGSWKVEGGVLTLTYVSGMQELRLLSVDADMVVVADEEGSIGHSYRCETAPADPGAKPLIPIA